MTCTCFMSNVICLLKREQQWGKVSYYYKFKNSNSENILKNILMAKVHKFIKSSHEKILRIKDFSIFCNENCNFIL
jgi:hypothetical protein